MLRARKAARAADRIGVSPVPPRPEEHRVLTLQRTIGNRAVTRLLQRDFVRDLGPTNAADWTPKRGESVNVLTLFEEIAKLAKAKEKLRDVKANGETINAARTAKEGEKDVKPGLNFVAKLENDQAGGETGFVDAEGVYRGPHLPVTLDGALPRVSVTLTGKAFDRGKDHAYAVLRHEMEHAAHFELMIDKLADWRKDAAKGGASGLSATASRERFDRWVTKSKSLDKVVKALLEGESAQNHASTELLAYTEGFMSVFHLGPQAPSISLMLTGDFPAAIHQLWKAGEKGQGAADAVRKAAIARIRDYEKNFLSAVERKAFRAWLTFLIDLGTQTPPQGQTDEAKAARMAHAKLEPQAVLDWLKSL
jgi:hypothetical protein